jgi:hypothetical protein
MSLTDIVCRTTKPAARLTKLSDGGGLQLWVQPNGSKLSRFAYRFGGKHWRTILDIVKKSRKPARGHPSKRA